MFCCKTKECSHVQRGIQFICMKLDCPEQTKQPCKQCYKDHKCDKSYIVDIKSEIVANNHFQVELQNIYQFLEEYKSSSNYCKTLIINYYSILLKQVNYFDLYLKQSLDLKYKGLFKQFMNEGTDQIQIIPFIFEGIQEIHQLLSNKITYNISDDSLQILSQLDFQRLKVQDSQLIIEHLQQKTMELDSRIKYNMSIQDQITQKDEFYFIFQEQKSIERFCQQHRQIKSEIFEVPSNDNKKKIQLIVQCKLCAIQCNLRKYDLNSADLKKQQINQLYKQIEKFKQLQMKEYSMITNHFEVIRKDIEQRLKQNAQLYCQSNLKDYDYEFSDLGLLRHQLLKNQELYNLQCVNMLRKIKRKYDSNQRIDLLIEKLERDLTNIIKIYNQKIKSLFQIIFSKDLLEYQLDTGRQLDTKQFFDSNNIQDQNIEINNNKETKGNQSKIQFRSDFLKKRAKKLETIPEDKQGFEQIVQQFQPQQTPDPIQVNSKEGDLLNNSKLEKQKPSQINYNQLKGDLQNNTVFPVIKPVYSEIQNSRITYQIINDELYQKNKQEQEYQEKLLQQQQLEQQQQKLLEKQQYEQKIQQEKEFREKQKQDEQNRILKEQQEQQYLFDKQREEQLEKQKQEEQNRILDQKKSQEQQQLFEQQKKQQQQNNQVVQPIMVVSQILNPQDNNEPKYFPIQKNQIQHIVPLEMKEKIKSQFNTLSVEIDNKQSKKSQIHKQNSISQIYAQFSQKYQKDYILYLNSDNQIFKQKNNLTKLQVQLPDESEYLIKQFLFWKIDKLIRQKSLSKDGPRYFLRANTFRQGHILVFDAKQNKIDTVISGRCETINDIKFFNNSIISCSSDGKLILYDNQVDVQPRYINQVRSELDLKNKIVQIQIIDNQSLLVLQHPQIDEQDRSVLFFDTIISLISYDSKTQKMKQEKDRRFNQLIMKMAIHSNKVVLGFKSGKIEILNVKDLDKRCIYEETLPQKQPVLGIAFNSKNLGIIQSNKFVTIRKFSNDMQIEGKLEIEKLYDYDSVEPEDIVIVDDQLIFSDRSILRLQSL